MARNRWLAEGGVVYKEAASWGKPTGHKALPTIVGSRYYPLAEGTNGGSITESQNKKQKKQNKTKKNKTAFLKHVLFKIAFLEIMMSIKL